MGFGDTHELKIVCKGFETITRRQSFLRLIAIGPSDSEEELLALPSVRSNGRNELFIRIGFPVVVDELRVAFQE